MAASPQPSLPLKRESRDVASQWRSLCLEFLDSRLRGNDGLPIFMAIAGEAGSFHCHPERSPRTVTPNAVRGLKSLWKGEVGPSKNFRFLALLGMTETRLNRKGAQKNAANSIRSEAYSGAILSGGGAGNQSRPRMWSCLRRTACSGGASGGRRRLRLGRNPPAR